ncbi:MAG TPA: hypothetical protein PLS10_04410 [Chitinophagales bacterium]|nr:hypothetical protein [Chitinophagales bacterium]
MIQEILAPIICLLLLFFIIGNKRFFKSDSISKQVLLIGFSLKAFSAVLFGYFYKSGMLTGGDTYLYFDDGNIVYSAVKADIFTYLKLAIGSNDFTPVPKYLLPYTTEMHFWFDSSNYFLVRLNALIRLFSLGVYNVHAIVFAFLSFIGTYNLYLFFENKVISRKLLQFILFGIPSIVFWTSGIHKEAIVIFALGTILYNLDGIMKSNYTKRNIFFAIFGLIVLGYIRIYLLAFLLPLMSAMILYKRFELRETSLKLFLGCIVFFVCVLLLIDMYTPHLSFMHVLLERRAFFLNSPGNMSFQVEGIPHNINGVLILLWEAVTNPFIRPLPNDCNVFLSYIASFETIILLLVFIGLLVTVNIKSVYSNPYAMFSILFGFSTLFLIGLIVNNSGAIVRYRSIAIPFILIGLCLSRKENKILTVSVK